MYSEPQCMSIYAARIGLQFNDMIESCTETFMLTTAKETQIIWVLIWNVYI